MLAYQGALDGLCGPYAVVNALQVCGVRQAKEELFALACSSLSKTRWPKVLWSGTTFGDLKRMISSCLRELPESPKVVVVYPFKESPPKTTPSFWRRFDEAFELPDVMCAIIRLNAPSSHWIVATRDKGRIVFLDSTAGDQIFRKNRASIVAGNKRPRGNQWHIDAQDIVLFRAF